MTTKPTLTPWYPTSIKPARPGVYRTSFKPFSSDDSAREGYSYWNGKKWSTQRPSRKRAEKADTFGAIQSKRWRGLAEDPQLS